MGALSKKLDRARRDIKVVREDLRKVGANDVPLSASAAILAELKRFRNDQLEPDIHIRDLL